MSLSKYFYVVFSFITLFAILFVGCKEDDHIHDPHHDHFEPEGWVIRDDTQKPLLVVFQGVILNNFKGAILSDTLYAAVDSLSPHYSVKFLDGNQNIINPPSSDEHSLGYVITDTNILEIHMHSPKEWEFHLKGKKTGKTMLELQVRHGSHADVKTPKIPVVVN